jgi:hypothetical protein
LTLESVDDIERSDGLALGVLSVGNGVTDDTLEEGLEDTTGLLVDHGGDTLDTTTAGKTTDSGLGDTLDVVTQNLAVTLGATLSETLATLAACSKRRVSRGSSRWNSSGSWRSLTSRHVDNVLMKGINLRLEMWR